MKKGNSFRFLNLIQKLDKEEIKNFYNHISIHQKERKIEVLRSVEFLLNNPNNLIDPVELFKYVYNTKERSPKELKHLMSFCLSALELFFSTKQLYESEKSLQEILLFDYYKSHFKSEDKYFKEIAKSALTKNADLFFDTTYARIRILNSLPRDKFFTQEKIDNKIESLIVDFVSLTYTVLRSNFLLKSQIKSNVSYQNKERALLMESLSKHTEDKQIITFFEIFKGMESGNEKELIRLTRKILNQKNCPANYYMECTRLLNFGMKILVNKNSNFKYIIDLNVYVLTKVVNREVFIPGDVLNNFLDFIYFNSSFKNHDSIFKKLLNKTSSYYKEFIEIKHAFYSKNYSDFLKKASTISYKDYLLNRVIEIRQMKIIAYFELSDYDLCLIEINNMETQLKRINKSTDTLNLEKALGFLLFAKNRLKFLNNWDKNKIKWIKWAEANKFNQLKWVLDQLN